MAVDGLGVGSKVWSELGEVVQLADDVVVNDDEEEEEEGITLGFSAVGVVERVPPLGDWLFDWLSLGEREALGDGDGDGDGVVDTVILADIDDVWLALDEAVIIIAGDPDGVWLDDEWVVVLHDGDGDDDVMDTVVVVGDVCGDWLEEELMLAEGVLERDTLADPDSVTRLGEPLELSELLREGVTLEDLDGDPNGLEEGFLTLDDVGVGIWLADRVVVMLDDDDDDGVVVAKVILGDTDDDRDRLVDWLELVETGVVILAVVLVDGGVESVILGDADGDWLGEDWCILGDIEAADWEEEEEADRLKLGEVEGEEDALSDDDGFMLVEGVIKIVMLRVMDGDWLEDWLEGSDWLEEVLIADSEVEGEGLELKDEELEGVSGGTCGERDVIKAGVMKMDVVLLGDEDVDGDWFGDWPVLRALDGEGDWRILAETEVEHDGDMLCDWEEDMLELVEVEDDVLTESDGDTLGERDGDWSGDCAKMTETEINVEELREGNGVTLVERDMLKVGVMEIAKLEYIDGDGLRDALALGDIDSDWDRLELIDTEKEDKALRDNDGVTLCERNILAVEAMELDILKLGDVDGDWLEGWLVICDPETDGELDALKVGVGEDVLLADEDWLTLGKMETKEELLNNEEGVPLGKWEVKNEELRDVVILLDIDGDGEVEGDWLADSDGIALGERDGLIAVVESVILGDWDADWLGDWFKILLDMESDWLEDRLKLRDIETEDDVEGDGLELNELEMEEEALSDSDGGWLTLGNTEREGEGVGVGVVDVEMEGEALRDSDGVMLCERDLLVVGVVESVMLADWDADWLGDWLPLLDTDGDWLGDVDGDWLVDWLKLRDSEGDGEGDGLKLSEVETEEEALRDSDGVTLGERDLLTVGVVDSDGVTLGERDMLRVGVVDVVVLEDADGDWLPLALGDIEGDGEGEGEDDVEMEGEALRDSDGVMLCERDLLMVGVVESVMLEDRDADWLGDWLPLLDIESDWVGETDGDWLEDWLKLRDIDGEREGDWLALVDIEMDDEALRDKDNDGVMLSERDLLVVGVVLADWDADSLGDWLPLLDTDGDWLGDWLELNDFEAEGDEEGDGLELIDIEGDVEEDGLILSEVEIEMEEEALRDSDGVTLGEIEIVILGDPDGDWLTLGDTEGEGLRVDDVEMEGEALRDSDGVTLCERDLLVVGVAEIVPLGDVDDDGLGDWLLLREADSDCEEDWLELRDADGDFEGDKVELIEVDIEDEALRDNDMLGEMDVLIVGVVDVDILKVGVAEAVIEGDTEMDWLTLEDIDGEMLKLIDNEMEGEALRDSDGVPLIERDMLIVGALDWLEERLELAESDKEEEVLRDDDGIALEDALALDVIEIVTL